MGSEGGWISSDATIHQDIKHRLREGYRFTAWSTPSTYFGGQGGDDDGNRTERRCRDDGYYGVVAVDG